MSAGRFQLCMPLSGQLGHPEKDLRRDDIFFNPGTPPESALFHRLRAIIVCVLKVFQYTKKRRASMGINFGMWKTAAWQLVKMEDKKEWDALDRSEERRVGKECRARWSST